MNVYLEFIIKNWFSFEDDLKDYLADHLDYLSRLSFIPSEWNSFSFDKKRSYIIRLCHRDQRNNHKRYRSARSYSIPRKPARASIKKNTKRTPRYHSMIFVFIVNREKVVTDLFAVYFENEHLRSFREIWSLRKNSDQAFNHQRINKPLADKDFYGKWWKDNSFACSAVEYLSALDSNIYLQALSEANSIFYKDHKILDKQSGAVLNPLLRIDKLSDSFTDGYLDFDLFPIAYIDRDYLNNIEKLRSEFGLKNGRIQTLIILDEIVSGKSEYVFEDDSEETFAQMIVRIADEEGITSAKQFEEKTNLDGQQLSFLRTHPNHIPKDKYSYCLSMVFGRDENEVMTLIRKAKKILPEAWTNRLKPKTYLNLLHRLIREDIHDINEINACLEAAGFPIFEQEYYNKW